MKFYITNADIFIKYFDSAEHYHALVKAGNYKKLEEIIATNTNFNTENFINQLSQKL